MKSGRSTDFIHECAGKIRYDDKAAAWEAARGISRRHNGKSVAGYKCSHCNKWHIGKRRKREKLNDPRRVREEDAGESHLQWLSC